MADASIALNRFGYGGRPNDAPPADPRRWLLDQFGRYQARPAAYAGAPGSREVSQALADYFAESRAHPRPHIFAMPAPEPAAPAMTATAAPMAAPGMTAGKAKPPRVPLDPEVLARRRQLRAFTVDKYDQLVGARIASAVGTDTPFVERMVHFWANHFAVSADTFKSIGFAGTLELEAIRPHVLGRFGDMLNAVERHPAMLLYLDQVQSIGPNSAVGQRIDSRGKRKVGLNENLGREIMELHTLGVRSGYSQADVTEFARALTGWTVAGIGQSPAAKLTSLDTGTPGDFRFVAELHEPGDRTIMGKRYAAGGEAQAQAVLSDLAVNPATATHLATKIARHFTGDAPPPALVDRLRTAFLGSGGDLPTVYRALIASPEAWVPGPTKFKSPWEWSVSSFRALGLAPPAAQPAVVLLAQLGQPAWKPASPAGYDDMTGTWAGPDAVLRRVEAASRLAAQVGDVDARALAARLFPDALGAPTQQALARAESPGQAITLLLVSPESLRR